MDRCGNKFFGLSLYIHLPSLNTYNLSNISNNNADGWWIVHITVLPLAANFFNNNMHFVEDKLSKPLKHNYYAIKDELKYLNILKRMLMWLKAVNFYQSCNFDENFNFFF